MRVETDSGEWGRSETWVQLSLMLRGTWVTEWLMCLLFTLKVCVLFHTWVHHVKPISGVSCQDRAGTLLKTSLKYEFVYHNLNICQRFWYLCVRYSEYQGLMFHQRFKKNTPKLLCKIFNSSRIILIHGPSVWQVIDHLVFRSFCEIAL